MDNLRWVLLLVGVALIAGIWGWSRLRTSRRESPDQPFDDPFARREPTMDGGSAPEENPRPISETPVTPGESETPDKILAIHILAPPRQSFRGTDIDAAARACGLIHGYMRIYNRHPDDRTDTTPVFGLANLIEPGSFDMENLEDMGTPGLTVFMTLPGPGRPLASFNDMLETARSVAEALGGDLQDESRSSLSNQRVENIREELREYERKQKLGRSN
jgi:cell division protein ZipA